MERIFLSYTYNPVDEYKQETDELVRSVKTMVEAMDLYVRDGVDAGGRAIDTEILERISTSDGLIAIMSPWQDQLGQRLIPPYVLSEFDFAKAHSKPAIRVLHDSLPLHGMFTNHEYVSWVSGQEVKVLLKLMTTLALWKKSTGRNIQIRISPSDLGFKFDAHNSSHRCLYQLLVNYEHTGWKQAKLWNEPGATYAFIPNFQEESKVQLRLELGNEIWESPFTDSMGQIELQKRS